jgi:hypothetical protein
MKRAIRPLLIASAVLLTLLTLARNYVAWRNAGYLSLTCGTWTALALDLKNGTFYRPLYGILGYGGTRYFPLHFILHAALLDIGIGPVQGGHILAGIAGLALLFGIYRVLRQLRIDSKMAACIALFVLAAESVQLGLLSIRGDILPAALNILGLSICMSPSIQRRQILGASLLFTLAFAAKETTLFGVGAVFLSFMLTGRIKQAVEILLATGIGCAGVVAAMLLATRGRIFAILRACAAGGGYSFPVGLLHLVMLPVKYDPIVIVFMILAFGALFALPRGKVVSIPALFFILTWVATAIILGSVFSSINHLVDLQVAAIIVVAAWLFDEETTQKDFGMAVLGFAALLSLIPQFSNLRHQDNVPMGIPPASRADSSGFREMLQLLGKQSQPILAENPLLPILAGQRPYVLDLYMVHTLCEKDASFCQPLFDATRHREFAAIILFDDVESERRMGGGLWPLGEIKEIEGNYELARVFPKAFVYLPRQTKDADRTSGPSSK